MRFGRLALVAIGGLLVPAPAANAASASLCQVSYTASFDPGLTGTGTSMQGGSSTLKIAGTASCPGQTPGAGNVSVGNRFTTAGPNGTTYTWQEPIGTVNGGCINNETRATAITRWNDGSISLVQYTTRSFTYGINLQGTGVASIDAVAVNPLPGQPATLTVSATRDQGAQVAAMLFAGANSPTAGQEAFTACSGNALRSVVLTGTQVTAGA